MTAPRRAHLHRHLPRVRGPRGSGAAFLVLAVLLACVGGAEEAAWTRGEAVTQLIAERGRNVGTGAVSLRDLAPFRWQRLHVFAPGTPAATVRDSVGPGWTAVAAAAPTDRPGAQLLVFTADGAVIAAAALPPDAARFAPALLGRGYAPDEAGFRVTHDSGAAPLLSR